MLILGLHALHKLKFALIISQLLISIILNIVTACIQFLHSFLQPLKKICIV